MKQPLYLFFCLLILSCSKGGSGEGEPQPDPSDGPNSENNPPEVPLLIFPDEDELCVDPELKFEWGNANDPDNDTVIYGLQISANRSFTEIIEDRVVTETNITLTMEVGQDYYWRVRAIDSKNSQSEYSKVWAFYVEGDPISNHIPYIPSLVSPPMGAEVTSASVVLEWQGSDIDNDSLSYDVYFGNSENPELYQSGVTQNSIEVSVSPNQSYYWKINVKDGYSTSNGETWAFTTIE
ncbi:hypothetical protein V1387_08620 [Allomuricauda taeanensis]|uniref:hypothetical protein n=1 Tax=Flagellimonas taeanensis TaxID=1005926 RepID=UPI002E7AD6FF|nr:hypothetical protein [Allomuricauda taeanensis]MEE1962744.1 hypothetical protein [Allomuricauda taeanensis]